MTCQRAAQRVVIELLDGEFGPELPLRGGVLMPLWVGDKARIACDLDYLVPSVQLQDAIATRVNKALTRPARSSNCGEVLRVETKVIKQDTASPGFRFVAVVKAGTTLIEQQVDVAFDDPVTQAPERVRLLHLDTSGVEAWAFPVESTLAWKIHELFEQPQWQFKHLYDVYAILGGRSIDRVAAAAALRLAFASRNTPLSQMDRLHDGDFGLSRERPRKWRRFRRQHHYLVTPDDHLTLVAEAASFVRSILDVPGLDALAIDKQHR